MTKSNTQHQNMSKTRHQNQTYYGPALDLPLGGFGPKVNANERGLE